MADLIERSAAIDALDKLARDGFTLQDYFQVYLDALKDVGMKIRELPAVDAVTVVRCKDCKYCDHGIDEDGVHFLKCLGWVYGGTHSDDYCSHGERREGETDGRKTD